MRDDLDKRLADVGEMIKSQREVAKLSVRRLADLAGVSNPYLSQIERGLRNRRRDPSADRQGIADQRGIALRTGRIPAAQRQAAVGVREAIAADQELSTEQRQALLNVYESFISSKS
jgi:transcriptional regulator with XRE-family HTH domain